jgi:hypothetical protein
MGLLKPQGIFETCEFSSCLFLKHLGARSHDMSKSHPLDTTTLTFFSFGSTDPNIEPSQSHNIPTLRDTRLIVSTHLGHLLPIYMKSSRNPTPDHLGKNKTAHSRILPELQNKNKTDHKVPSTSNTIPFNFGGPSVELLLPALSGAKRRGSLEDALVIAENFLVFERRF